MTDVKPIELYNLGQFGTVVDTRPHLIPPEAWSGSRNVDFTKDGVSRSKGYVQTFGTLSITPQFVFNVPALGASFWMYASLTKVYVYESGVHTNITRQSVGVDVDYTTAAGRDWQGTILGGVPLLNNGADVPQYWPTLSAATKLANLLNWPATLRAKKLVAFGSYLVALNLVEGTTVLSSAVRWSHKTDPGTIPSSWDFANPAVDAGRTQITDTDGGEIFDALLLGNQLIIYKQYSTHTMRFVGGQDIMGFDLLLTDSGILAPKCVCLFKKGTRHFVVTADDVIVHAGTKEVESVADDRVREEIFTNLDTANFLKSFCFENAQLSQCWFVYPTAGSSAPNRAAVWNYKDNTWGFRDWDGDSVDAGSITDASADTWDSDSQVWDADTETWSTETRLQIVVVSTAAVKAWRHNVGYKFGDSTVTSYVERAGLAIDGKSRDGQPKGSIQSMKQLSRLWPKVAGNTPLNVILGSQDLVEGPLTTMAAKVFNPLTDKYVDQVVTGRLLYIRYESPANDLWTLAAHDLEIVKLSAI